MTLIQGLWRAVSLPPYIVVRKAASRARRSLARAWLRRRDLQLPTYALLESRPEGPLLRYFRPVPPNALRSCSAMLAALAQRYVAHQFDLLGSGWVQVHHGMRCRGLERYRYEPGTPVEADPDGRWLEGRINPANLAESRRVWRLADPGYRPIDWHLDFKSGYRWSESTWYLDVRYGHLPGVDVKVPWELARMQHLPVLALACALAGEERQELPEPGVLVREFRNQVLDFVAANPPRYGVNWHCTMDVAIRVTNWLVAYDLLRACGACFDDRFEAVFRRSVYEHGRHIDANLEWSPELRGNHYLVNVAGLLFVAAYLPRTPEVDAWLAFGVQELVAEVGHQFQADGSNFEASTSYQRLSAETVTYATALLLGLPEAKHAALWEYDWRAFKKVPPLRPDPLPLAPLPGSGRLVTFPAWYLERLERMAEFIVHSTGPGERVPQIGDNDSGRFLKLLPTCRRLSVAAARARYRNLDGYQELPDDAEYWDEEHLDHRHLVAAINGLFDRPDLAAFAGDREIETAIIHELSGGVRVASYRSRKGRFGAERVRIPGSGGRAAELGAPEAGSVPGYQAPGPSLPGSDLRSGLELFGYPDFGLYIFRSRRVHLVVRCGSTGQDGYGGHAHNDQLSFELSIDDVPLVVDPGTYLYTALPEQRNRFRSTSMHNTLCPAGREQILWEAGPRGLFRLVGDIGLMVEQFDEHGFAGRHEGFGVPHCRRFRLLPTAIVIQDEYEAGGEKAVLFHLAPGVRADMINPGGGVDLAANHVRVKMMGGPGGWSVHEDTYSPGYGLLERSLVVQLRSHARQIEVMLEPVGRR